MRIGSCFVLELYFLRNEIDFIKTFNRKNVYGRSFPNKRVFNFYKYIVYCFYLLLFINMWYVTRCVEDRCI